MENAHLNYKNFQTIIDAKSKSQYWKDIREYRELLWVFALRDISVRYKQTVIGVLWVLIKPVLTMLAFTVVFNRIVKVPETTLPYPLMSLAGIIPWYFFSGTILEMANSIVSNSQIVSKVYFPRMVLPLSSIFIGLVDLGVSFVFLVILMFYYGYYPQFNFLAIIPFTGLAILNCMAFGFLFSALNVSFRDVRYVVPFVLQFGLYVSPVAFSSTLISEKWRLLYSLNPIVGVIDGYRWAIEGTGELYWPSVLASLMVSIIMIIIGFAYFRKVEKTFADVI